MLERGAGFPGIPLKIVYPELEVVLLDSLNKRVKFLNAVIENLGLTGITAIHGRAEDIAKQKEYREGFDLVVSWAVAVCRLSVSIACPFVKTGGMFVPYKSGSVDTELSEASRPSKCWEESIGIPYGLSFQVQILTVRWW